MLDQIGVSPDIAVCAPRLIGFHGRARSGKDTSCELMTSVYGGQRVAFGDPLKDGLAVMLGLSYEELNGHEKDVVHPDFGVSPRYMLQTLGTEWGRKLIHSDLWLLVAEREIKALLADGYNVYVTDIRFENEADLVRELGGVVFHIRRPGVDIGSAHQSETPLCVNEGDVVIYNSGTRDDLLTALIEAKESTE